MVWGGGVKRNSCRETVFFTPRRRFWLWCAAQLAESCLLQNRETWCRWEVGLRHIFLRRSQLSRTRWGRRRRWGAGDYSVKLWIGDLRRYWDNFWKRTKSLNPSQLISKHFKHEVSKLLQCSMKEHNVRIWWVIQCLVLIFSQYYLWWTSFSNLFEIVW